MIRTVKRRNSDLSRATDSIIQIPCPEGFAYDGYQKAAVQYALDRLHTLIADEPGLGKTIEAIGVANKILCRRVLIICPAFLKPNWRTEFNLWDTNNLDIEYVKDGKDRQALIADVVIINYELLDKYYDEIRLVNWDLLVVDEVHKLKNKRAERTLQIFGGIRRNGQGDIVKRYSPIIAKKYLYLTGTPVLNGKPKEIWPLCQRVDPTGLGSDWFQFAKRYCNLIELKRFDWAEKKEKRIGWDWSGAENLEELQKRMRDAFMIRRLKADVLKDLKPKRRGIIPVESNKKIQKILDAEMQEFNAWAAGRPDEETMIDMPAFGDFSKGMLKVGLTMVEPCIEIAESELEERGKIVIMCYHNDVARQIADHFGNRCVLINGDVAPDKRQALVDRFQTEDGLEVVVGTFGSCSEGLTMTGASLMLCPERPWVPGQVTQGEDRIHRRGQKDSVLIKHLVRQNSLSERQVKILLTKQAFNDRMLDVEAK